MDLSGKRLGHIRVERILGQGGMGDVYEGFDEKLMRRVALKALHRDQRLDDEARTRLIREARTLSQLDHPNICRIHDYVEGADADVLVLEFIEGRTLQRAIEEGQSRAEKLRIAQAIAEVLVVAHRAGVVHRDLKPENVMLTRDGVVKVLDFGLARWVERQQSSDRLRAVQAATVRMAPQPLDPDRTHALARVLPQSDRWDTDRAAATAAGVTVGTPMFMSPEQARGEPLTPASDMYSFGLLLQALFTSADPYPSQATGREVMLMAARGESRPIRDVSHDIASLITRLKALAPTDRPTAVEAAARLRLIADKPKRIAQYAAAALLVLAMVGGTWKYIVDVRKAQKEAVHRRAQAEDLINFMVGDLRPKLESVGRLEILDDVAKRALAYESSLTADAMTPEEAARNVKALQQLGEVRIAQGRLPEAQDIFARTLKLAEGAHARAPRDPELRLAVAVTHFWIGNAYRLRGDAPNAMRELQAYLAGAEQLAKEYPANERYQLERADGHSLVGMLLQQKDLRQALEHFLITRSIKGALVAAKPEDLNRHAELALTIDKIGFVYLQLGNLSAAQEQFAAEHEMYVRLLAADPHNIVWKRRSATNETYTTLILELRGETDRALRRRQEEIAMWSEIVDRDPTNVDMVRNLAMSYLRLGMNYRIKGDFAAALREHDEAKALIERVVAREPHRPSFGDDAVSILIGRGRVLLAAGRLGEAMAAVDAAEARLQANGAAATAGGRVAAGMLRGDILQARGDAAGASSAWSKAELIAETRARSSSDLMIIDPWASLLLRLGRSAEAQPLLERLDRQGYRHPDLIATRQRTLGPV